MTRREFLSPATTPLSRYVCPPGTPGKHNKKMRSPKRTRRKVTKPPQAFTKVTPTAPIQFYRNQLSNLSTCIPSPEMPTGASPLPYPPLEECPIPGSTQSREAPRLPHFLSASPSFSPSLLSTASTPQHQQNGSRKLQKQELNGSERHVHYNPTLIADPPFTPPFLQREHSSPPGTDMASQCSSSLSPQFLHSQYLRDFVEIRELGRGSFGTVMLVMHRLDGLQYAIKRSERLIKGKRDLRIRLREAQALSRCLACPNIVRYFNCWIEDERLFVQTEHCGKGSVAQLPVPDGGWSEEFLIDLAAQVCNGLHFIHSHSMAHLDIKMENIYVTNCNEFKIGDFGLVALLDKDDNKYPNTIYNTPMTPHQASPHHTSSSPMQFPSGLGSGCSQASRCSAFSVMEGDARYLPLDMLNEKQYLREADIFSLGASIFEMAIGRQLPKGGEQWQRIRQGEFEFPAKYSPDFARLIRSMMHKTPLSRPTALQILHHPLVDTHLKMKAQSIWEFQRCQLLAYFGSPCVMVQEQDVRTPEGPQYQRRQGFHGLRRFSGETSPSSSSPAHDFDVDSDRVTDDAGYDRKMVDDPSRINGDIDMMGY